MSKRNISKISHNTLYKAIALILLSHVPEKIYRVFLKYYLSNLKENSVNISYKSLALFSLSPNPVKICFAFL